MKSIFLTASVVLTLLAVLPYVRDILQGRTKPNLTSWITWSLLTGVATIAEGSAGQTATAIYTGAACLETIAVVALGLRHGHVKYSSIDVICQVGALVGFLLWWLFDSPAAAVVAAVTIDFVGSLPTLRHAWGNPREETWITYALSAVGGLLAIFALTTYNWVSLPYVVYIVLINTTVAAVVIWQKHRLTQR
jgi:hypothetical protein